MSIDLTQKNIQIGNFSLLSQKPSMLPPADRPFVRAIVVPSFLKFWVALEDVTGYRWKCTSFIRDSPSHRKGQAIDFAPDIAPRSFSRYAVGHGSDPVLYKRTKMIRALQSLVPVPFTPPGYSLGVFIEPDHLHVQILNEDGRGSGPTRIHKWKQPKLIYADTLERMKLPMFN